jgi:hypothetical protein
VLKSIVVPPSGGSVLSMTRGDTGDGIMPFEETASAGPATASPCLALDRQGRSAPADLSGSQD